MYNSASSGHTICVVSLVIGHPDIDMDACHVSHLHLLSHRTILRLLAASADVTTLYSTSQAVLPVCLACTLEYADTSEARQIVAAC